MTEYQIATLDLREWTMWIAAAALVVSAIVGGVQCFLIWRGLVIMRRAADTRDRALENQRRDADQRHAEAMKAGAERHAEAMKAMDEERREADRRHTAAMQAMADERRDADRRHTETMEAIEAQSARLEALIEGQARTNETLAANTATLAEATTALRAQTRSLDAQTRSLETLLERTAPRAGR